MREVGIQVLCLRFSGLASSTQWKGPCWNCANWIRQNNLGKLPMVTYICPSFSGDGGNVHVNAEAEHAL